MRKKIIYAFAAVAIMFSVALSSCGNKEPKDMSNMELIEQYQKLSMEGLKAVAKGDEKKQKELEDQIGPLFDELEKRELTPEEEAKMDAVVEEQINKGMEYLQQALDEAAKEAK